RTALATHPKAQFDCAAVDASASRLLVCAIIGAVESLLRRWSDRPAAKAYFEKGSNENRIKALTLIVHECGVEPDPALLEDFLAAKYLRNTLQHSRWKEEERNHIESRGFPTSLDRLGLSEWTRLIQIGQEVLRYLVGAHMSDWNKYMCSGLAE